MTKTNRIISLLLMLILVLSLTIPAFAAKPTASTSNKYRSIARGRTQTITFTLKSSAEYGLKAGRFRAVFRSDLWYGSYSSSGTYTGMTTGKTFWSGNYKLKCRYKFGSKWPTGKYVIHYYTGYHSKGVLARKISAGDYNIGKWRVNTNKTLPVYLY